MIDRFEGQYRFLSNFYPCEIHFSGEVYPSVEHAYQASKCLSKLDGRTDEMEAIRQAPTPSVAKRLGRKVALHPQWEGRKVDIMLSLLRKKFSDAGLAERLLATGDAELIEGNWWGDTFWGACNGKGQNKLGELLMRVRTELRETKRG